MNELSDDIDHVSAHVSILAFRSSYWLLGCSGVETVTLCGLFVDF